MTSELPKATLAESAWKGRAAKHLARAQQHTVPARKRRDCGAPHPIEDFLFQYYPYPLALLEKWHPGNGVVLECSEVEYRQNFSHRFYQFSNNFVFLEIEQVSEKERERFSWIREMLIATQGRLPNFACHGLHEWAMVYQGEQVRHEKTTPLRLSQQEIDAFVESRSICCSHHDAFRFFSKSARPLNRLQPTLESRLQLEQPGCIHANMDLYKWAAKTMPWISSEILLDCFELAIELRDLDMRASPYDLTAWGRGPICIETADGRRTYETEQRKLAAKATLLRAQLIDALAAFER